MIKLNDNNFFSIKDNFQQNREIESKLLYGERKCSPVVSIMIPTYLRNNFLKEAIDSALRQKTDIEYEVVVVDNNSDIDDSNTLNLIRNYDKNSLVYYKNAKNLGMFGNWNRCLELASGKWVLILHDDDTITDDYISQMLRIVNHNPGVACIGCNNVLIDENGNNIILKKQSRWKKIKKITDRILERESYGIKTKDFFFVHPINIMGLFLNKDSAIQIGGFDERWAPTSDYIFILNMARKFNVLKTNKKLLNYRQAVNASLSVNNLIGMVEIDAYMRKFINAELNVLSKTNELIYRSAVVINHENTLRESWFTRLTDDQKLFVNDEYNEFNRDFGLKTVSKQDIKKVIMYQRFYNFEIEYIRSK